LLNSEHWLDHKLEKQVLTGFGIANYRSFDSKGVYLDGLSKINFLIGKNNCGKSNILRALLMLARASGEYRIQLDGVDRHHGAEAPLIATLACNIGELIANPDLVESYLHGNPPEVRVKVELRSQSPVEMQPIGGNRDFLGHLHHLLTKEATSGSVFDLQKSLEVYFARRLINRLEEDLKNFTYVPPIRELRIGNKDKQVDCFNFDGENVIIELARLQGADETQWEKRKLFAKIEAFVADLLESKDIKLEIPFGAGKILVVTKGQPLPLSSCGTGIHQLVILCSAIAMYEDHVFCIEEPEIHIHPQLQRKFLSFLSTTKNRYFIATHSNVFLDACEDVSIYHVTSNGTRTSIYKVETNKASLAVLSDLGYKASDLLQANGIIWVEGPSDRYYINRWITLLASDLVEGVHYSIMFYGGANLTHCSASSEDDSEGPPDLVPLLKINPKAVVVMDRDDASINSELAAWKQRIISEIGDDNVWVTEGREVENYIRPELIESYLKDRYNQSVKVRLSKRSTFERAVRAALKGAKIERPIDYGNNKAKYSKVFAAAMTLYDVDSWDLKTRINALIEKIRKWNQQDQPLTSV